MQCSNNLENDNKVRKTKRNRRKTECTTLRSKTGCGVCGSQNVAHQGVLYCQICGEEEEYLIQLHDYGMGFGADVTCDCVEYSTSSKGALRIYRKIKNIGVYKCIDCGAVGNKQFCPNNGSITPYSVRTCWKHWKGSIYCQVCGYRKGE